MRVLGVIRDLTGDWGFLHIEREGDKDRNERDRDRDMDRDRDREREEKEKRRRKNNRHSYNSDDDDDEENDNDNGVRVVNQRGYNSRNTRYSDDDTAPHSGEKESYKKERKEALNLAVEIIFASHASIKSFPEALCGARNMQLECLSNLLNSPNINEFKQKMVPIIVGLMADCDVRNRLLVTR